MHRVVHFLGRTHFSSVIVPSAALHLISGLLTDKTFAMINVKNRNILPLLR